MIKLAPICLFTYRRLDETQRTIAALQRNFLAAQSELFIFSDGWKSDVDKERIVAVRRYLKQITGFKQVSIFESNDNRGLANSIITGVTKIIEEYGKVIVLEDDLITSPNFLNFMNQGLDFYLDNDRIFSISGFTFDLPILKNESSDFYYGYRASSWGWATWRDRWRQVDWEVKDYQVFVKSRSLRNKFRRGGSDLPRMLQNQMKGKIDSWAIRWCYQEFKNDQLTVFPSKSKVESIGIGSMATHTKRTNRFSTVLDVSNKEIFTFNDKILLNKVILKEYKYRYSLFLRVLDRFILK